MKSFTILGHNVFWFQGVPFPTDRPRGPDPEILRRLCAIYRKVHPDVICLQEIQSQETFDAVSEQLGMPGCYCRGGELPQYGGAVFWYPGGGRQIGDSQEASVKTQRMWQIVEVNIAGCRLRICNIHLPSGRQIGPEQAAVQRMSELRQLLQNCETEPDIIVGDFNEQPGGPASEYLERHGYVDSAVLAGRGDVPTNVGGGRGDYIWIKRWWVDNGSLNYDVADKQALECNDGGKQYLSDHLPLWITVEIP